MQYSNLRVENASHPLGWTSLRRSTLGIKLIAIANVIVIEYMITSYYKIPYKWAGLVLTAIILTALLVRKKGSPQ